MTSKRQIRSNLDKLLSLSSKRPDYYYVHGFITGLAVGPEMIMPSQWQPQLLGEIEFESESQLELLQSLNDFYNNIMQDAMNDALQLPAQCKFSPDKPELSLSAEQPLPQWCTGFLTSLNLIDQSLLSEHKFNIFSMVETSFIAFTSYVNLRAACRHARQAWRAEAMEFRRELKSDLSELLNVLRFNSRDEHNADMWDNEAELLSELSPDFEALDDFDEMLDFALYDNSKEAQELTNTLIHDFEKSHGPEFFKENAGYFWGIHETRPYMMLRDKRARIHFEQNRHAEAIAELQELIRLNPNDNQGCRFALASWLVIEKDWSALRKLVAQYDDSGVPLLAANALMLYAHAPDSVETKAAKKPLLAANKHLVKYLTGQKTVKEAPEFFSPGQASEVEMYLMEYGKEAWRSVPGALFWLRQK